MVLFGSSTDNVMTADLQVDYGVILYSCSFAVIFLMILSQARRTEWGSKRARERSETNSHSQRGIIGETCCRLSDGFPSLKVPDMTATSKFLI